MTCLGDLIEGNSLRLVQQALDDARSQPGIDFGGNEERWRGLLGRFGDSLLRWISTGGPLPRGFDEWAAPADLPGDESHESSGLVVVMTLVKCYRRRCLDLMRQAKLSADEPSGVGGDIESWFDASEVALCSTWSNRVRAEPGPVDEQRVMLQALLKATPDLVLFKNADSVFRAVSDTYCRLLGRDRDDIIGHDDSDLFPAEDARQYRAEEVGVMEGGVVVSAEHVLQTTAGERVYDVIKLPLRDDGGNVVGLMSAERDVTERKRIEAALAAEKERLGVTLRSIGDGVITTDTVGRITMLNRAAEELTGWSSFEATGKRLDEVFSTVDERTGGPCENPVERVLRTGQVVTLANHTALLARDGSRRIIADSGAPICDATGRVLGVVLVFRDVTEQKRAQEAILQERDFAQSVLETAQAIVLVLDLDGNIIRFNRYVEELSGHALSDVKGKNWFDIFLPPGERRSRREEFLSTVNGSASQGGVHPLLTKFGQVRQIEHWTRTLKDVEGCVIGILSVGIDITDRLAAARERDEQRRMLEALLEITPDIIIFKDRQHRFQACSRTISGILGRSREEMTGRTDFDLFPTEKAEHFWNEEVRVMEGREAINVEHQLDAPDGPHWFETIKMPLLDEDGEVVGLLSAERDITQRKVVDEALRKAQELLELRVQERTADLAVANVKLQVEVAERKAAEAELQWQYQQAERARTETTAILDATGEAMVLVSPEGWVLSVNRRFAEFFGMGSAEVLGKRLQDMSGDLERLFADPSWVISILDNSLTDAESRFTQLVTQRWPRQRELEIFSNPVRTLKSELLGRMYVFRDVTREREVDRMKTDFVSLVSHELRTPLTSIKGYVDLLLGDKVGRLGDDQKRFLTIVKNNADRLVALINDLLDVSRIESGKMELKRTTLDLGRLIQDVGNSLRPQLEAKHQRMTITVSPDMPTISGDADRISAILTNLISNAYKYTPASGDIWVSATREDERVRVDVKDSGIGMTPEEKSKLFTKFFRAENRMTAEVGGTGLGLVITKSLIEMHGGEITVASVPGEGSTFSFTLPTKAAAVDKKPRGGDDEASLMAKGAGRRILVVDDEPDIAGLIRLYLERAGYHVALAHNAHDALRIAKVDQPDLITLDVMLPDADGFTALEWLKNEPATKSIPVVMISIMPDDGHGKVLGAIDYLVKPVPERILLEHLQEILRAGGSQTIVLADDDLDTRSLLATQLLRAGYEVLEAVDGQEALDLIRKNRPGVALLDIKMPNMDGISLLKVLRQSKETRDLPVIMMTASPGLLDASRSITEILGVSALLNKPFTAEELAAAIAQGLSRPR